MNGGCFQFYLNSWIAKPFLNHMITGMSVI